jgi:outer membrane protein OmpA-like peptidoglycan-associated protein
MPAQPGTAAPTTAQTPTPGQQPQRQGMPAQPGTTAPGTAQTPTPGQQPQRQGMPAQPGTTAPGTAQTPTPGQQPQRQGMPAQPGAAPPATALSPAMHPVPANVPLDPKAMPQRLDQVKAQRTETHEGNTTIIKESNRTIIQEGGQTVIRHDASDRFRLNAQSVNVQTRGNITVTAVVQPGGFQIVTETDATGRMLRRIRRDLAGREVVLIDNSFEPRGPGIAGFVLDLRPPVIPVTIAPQLYIRDMGPATTLADVSLTLMAPPVVAVERRYSLDEILYNEPLRARMPRIDIDTVNFETGSWEIAPDQGDRLAFVAQGIMAAIKRNPSEMFLVEGYTDAVGNDVDNLSLSDHRAESVAVMLTSQFGVPAENLTTQGYGKQFLKVPTPGPERANRRVAVRRITPLLNGGQS